MVNHPIAYAFVAVCAAAIVVYQYFSNKQTHGHRNGRSRSPPRRFDHDVKPDKPDNNNPKKPGYKPDNRPRKPDNPDDKPGKPIGKPDDKSKETTGKLSDKPAKELESSSKSSSSPTSINENSVCRYRKPHSERLNESKQEDDNTTVLKMKDTPPREQDQKVSDSKEMRPTSSGFIKNEVQNSSFNDVSNQKMVEKTYEKNVLNRLVNETKCINKDPKEEVKLSNNNILEDSESDESDSESYYESDSDNGLTLNYFIDRALHQAACPAEDSQNKKNQEKEDEMKEAYKQEVTDKFKRDIENGCEDTASGGDTFDDLDIEKVRSRISNNMQQKKCSGCEEKPCDAVVLPCEHCYLCKDCAKFVVKCSPKCSICLADINDFR